MNASSRLSVRSCRTSRDLVAPSDSRTDSSLCLVVARDSSRLATFAHTISSTSATIVVRIDALRTSLEFTSYTPRFAESTRREGTSLRLRFCAVLRAESVNDLRYESRPALAVFWNTVPRLACTCVAVAPGFSRPMT